MRKKRALIVTVGTGTRPDVYIVKPLVKSIRDSRPEFLVLATTEGSRKYGEAIVQELSLNNDSYQIAVLQDYDDFQSVFLQINQIMRHLIERGYEPGEIQIDFTSGTKAMSSGAVLAAVHGQCESIKYITGKRRNGVVVDGSERFLTVNPEGFFALQNIGLAEELIRQMRFASADQVLGAMVMDLLDSEDQRKVINLRSIAQLYHEWDLFKHKEALQQIKKVEWDMPGLQNFRPSSQGCVMMEEFIASQRDGFGFFLLLDIFNNARRRRFEGKYDDAVARLYRAAELFAQTILKTQYGIDTADVDINKVPHSIKNLLLKKREVKTGKIRIALYDDFSLLDALGHTVGHYYLNNESLQGQIRERNQSIYAHGLKPMTQKQCKNFELSIIKLFCLEIPDFEEKARMIQFPWLI